MNNEFTPQSPLITTDKTFHVIQRSWSLEHQKENPSSSLSIKQGNSLRKYNIFDINNNYRIEGSQ